MIRIHKEVCLNSHWHHEGGVIVRELDEEQFLSILSRYCLGTLLLPDEHFGDTVTALDYSFSRKNIKDETIILLRAADIVRLRKAWPEHFDDFDKTFGYFLWDSGDIAGFPDEMMENRTKWHFEDYRIFLWVQ
jgi:hypothetical protein